MLNYFDRVLKSGVITYCSGKISLSSGLTEGMTTGWNLMAGDTGYVLIFSERKLP